MNHGVIAGKIESTHENGNEVVGSKTIVHMPVSPQPIILLIPFVESLQWPTTH